MGDKDTGLSGHGGPYVRFAYTDLSQEAEHRIGLIRGIEVFDYLRCSESFVRRKPTRLDEVVYCNEVGIWRWRLSSSSGGEKAIKGGGEIKRWTEVREAPQKENRCTHSSQLSKSERG